jgi:hypothetical protein
MIEIIFEVLVKHNSKYYMFTLLAKIRIFFQTKVCFSQNHLFFCVFNWKTRKKGGHHSRDALQVQNKDRYLEFIALLFLFILG